MSANEFRIQLYGEIPVVDQLPPTWKQDLVGAIKSSARVVILHLDNPTSREDDFKGREFPTIVAPGDQLVAQVPWLEEFYKGPLLEIVQSKLDEQALPLEDLAVALTGNVLRRRMRFESHVDHWPVGAN